MLPVDSAMLGQGYAYYRYMDDVRVVVATHHEARAALQHLTTELRRLGLNMNSARPKTWEPSMSDYDQALGTDEPLLAQIEHVAARSLPVIRRSFAPLMKLSQDLIARGATQERGFRFCVQRFESRPLF